MTLSMKILPTLRSRSPRLFWASSAIPAVGNVSCIGIGLLFAHSSKRAAARRLLIWYCFFTSDSFLGRKFPRAYHGSGKSRLLFYDFPDIFDNRSRPWQLFFIF